MAAVDYGDNSFRRLSLRFLDLPPPCLRLGRGQREIGDRAALQQRLEIMPGVAGLHRRHLLRRSFGHNHPALDAAFGAEVDDPVGGLDDVEIMLDHDHAVALLDEAVEDFEELADIVEMEAGGGFVEDVERVAGGAAAEFLGELDALGLAA